MNTRSQQLPIGFQGPVRTWSGLVPAAARLRQWPGDAAQLRSAAPAGLELLEVCAITESLGRVEDGLAMLAGHLADGGTMLLDVDNLQSLRMLRLVVEGHPGSFEPAGSSEDPAQALPLRRVLLAAQAAGLWVKDVVAVPSVGSELGPEFAADLLRRGLLPVRWLAGPPPTRFWLTCCKQPALAGSVLLAGTPTECERTRSALRQFLPADWEIVTGDGQREIAQWNRGVAAARGELLWFLRGGSVPDRALFTALLALAGLGPVAPASPSPGGDLSGLMLPRWQVLLLGPLPEHYRNSQVALEEYGMALATELPPLRSVPGELVTPAPAVESPACFAAESAALLARFGPLLSEQQSPGVHAGPPPAPPWSGRQPRISLCMIARNEERFLPECLRRARPAVDEIILVDTGSTDRTKAIAAEFGATVLDAPWQDDFSAPRNVALAAATGDWILVLDADEFLQDGAAERIRELAVDPGVAGYHMHFINVYGTGRTMGVMMVRLFRNLPGLAYTNLIHEQVTPSLQRLAAPLGLRLRSCDVQVDHHGYSDQVMTERGKIERNERLFLRQLAAEPDDIYTLYKYGDFLRRVPGRSADARRLLDQCLDVILAGPPSLPRELPYAGEVAALCALEAARAGDTLRARQVIDHALRRFLPTPNLHYLAASLALAEQRSEAAIAHYQRCLAYHGQVLVVPIQEGITSYVSLAGIAQAWLQRGCIERAERMLEQAIAIEPTYEVAQLALSRLHLHRGDLAKALRVLTTFLAAHPDSPGACQQTTLLLHRLGQTAAAQRMGRHAVQLLEARALGQEAAAMQRILAAM
jgi:tetratricopeptide (TPR) repeat protein